MRLVQILLKQVIRPYVNELEMLHTDWTEDASRLNVPVRVLIGKQNTYQPSGAIRKYVEATKDAKVKYITAAGGHQNLTHFSRILEVIRDLELREKTNSHS